MGILIGFLTVVLVMDCLILILLILIQLPKKDAGAGLAFGGGATDALFGAGSGNALTKITKYSAGLFIGLSLLLSVLNVHRVGRTGGGGVAEALRRKAAAGSSVIPAPTNTAAATTSVPVLQLQTPTNAPASTSPPAATTPPANNPGK